MRPYARKSKLTIRQKVFNYRICRPRRIIENCFGLLAQRFRIFRQPIIAPYKTAIKIIQAAVCMHNFILQRQPANLSDETTVNELKNISQNSQFVPCDVNSEDDNIFKCVEIRNYLADYFMHKGSVSWQWQKVRNCDY